MPDAPLCDAPVPGGCPKPAREVILARAGENVIGNGMAVWSAMFRCGGEHKAGNDANRIKAVDPDAIVYVFQHNASLAPGFYLGQLAATRWGDS